MRKIFPGIKYPILLLVGISFSLSVLFAHPSTATIPKSTHGSNLSLINEVKSPSSLNRNSSKKLDQPFLITELIDTMQIVQEQLSKDFQVNQSLGIILGSDSPVKIGTLPDDKQLANQNYMAVGYLNLAGAPLPITSGQILKMVASLIALNKANNLADTIIQDRGFFGSLARNLVRGVNREVVKGLAETSFNLLVYNSQQKKMYLAEQTNPNALLRDAINGTLNNTLKKLNFSDFEIPEIKIDPKFLG